MLSSNVATGIPALTSVRMFDHSGADDPRVTRVGRILRATSIDELPQLVDVIAGNLSLVGPRPALPDEVAAFDDELRRRHRVIPGVTGLWQVEARHNPSFYAYRHLDLFYVDNWTIGLDIVILLATAKTVEADRLRRTMEAAEAERRRWARELHDETLQGLAGLKVLLLSGASRLDDREAVGGTLRDAVDAVTRELENLRTIIADVRPAALDQLGLLPALRSLARRTS